MTKVSKKSNNSGNAIMRKASLKSVSAGKKKTIKKTPQKNKSSKKKNLVKPAEKLVKIVSSVLKKNSLKVVAKKIKINASTYPNYNLNSEELSWFKDFNAYVNYLGAGMLYLKDNALLKRPLSKSDVKDRPLGHWGTVPGLNFIYSHCNFLIKRHKFSAFFITGPGHGAPANLACNFADGSMEALYKQYSRNEKGTSNLLKDFSWPYKLPSHVTPAVPGSILEGGELGYSLSTAFGAAMDNPEKIVFCVVGDGEAETGPVATAWHSNKFLNPKESGAVLPIVHINGYKISGPTIYSTMSNEELEFLFKGYGYEPMIVEGDDDEIYFEMADKMEAAYQMIRNIQLKARKKNQIMKPKWPVILLRSKKGWTGTKMLDGKKIEDNFRSHGVPLSDIKKNSAHFDALKKWLESYDINSLVDKKGSPLPKILKFVPDKRYRMGTLPDSMGGVKKELYYPNPEKYEFKSVRGLRQARPTAVMAEWLKDLMLVDAKKNKVFRFFCPDETDSNKFGVLVKELGREYVWPVKKGEEDVSPEGRVVEMLSEHTLQGFLQGYNLTGRHGLFVTYEAFAMITASMIDQHLKFIKQTKQISWRKPVPSLNYILSSVEWRQEHNGYSHQNPGLISTIIEKHGEFSSVFFPADGNTLIVVMEECLKRRNAVNVIESCKQEIPQWQSIKEARQQLKTGISIWNWVDPKGAKNPHVVFAAAGDYMVEEMMAAIDILKNEFPMFNIRFVNVLEMSAKGIGNHKKAVGANNLKGFYSYFTEDKPVIFNFHGYPQLVHKLLFGVPFHSRFHVNGYLEEGSTTTPFDMHVRNGTSRFHIIVQAMTTAGIKSSDTAFAKRAWAIKKKYEKRLKNHKDFVIEHGKDFADVVDWQWGK